jgi:hypothetical protein
MKRILIFIAGVTVGVILHKWWVKPRDSYERIDVDKLGDALWNAHTKALDEAMKLLENETREWDSAGDFDYNRFEQSAYTTR